MLEFDLAIEKNPNMLASLSTDEIVIVTDASDALGHWITDAD